MAFDGLRIVRMVFLGVLVVLGGLTLFWPAQAHTVAPAQGRQDTLAAPAVRVDAASYPRPTDRGCRTGWLCCALATCPMVSLDLQRGIDFVGPLGVGVVTYGSPAVILLGGLPQGPATPPPRPGA